MPIPDWVAGTALPWLSEEASVFGKGPLIVANVAECERLSACRAELGASVLIGIDESGTAPQAGEIFDVYLTTATAPAKPWVHVQSIAESVETLQAAIGANPNAAVALVQVLRAQPHQSFEQALQIESFAYSTLLGGAEFRRWRAAHPHNNDAQKMPERGPAVVVERKGDTMCIELARPDGGNALTAELRDALVEALRGARLDDTIGTVEIRGRGRVFCSGGALGEFGMAQDLAVAHQLRTIRSAALALHRLGACSRAFIQGAAVGGGIEFAAAAHDLIAHPSAFFQLPEISMGLIPGAGGTVTVARRIGWQRTAYMALSGARIRARTALSWDLIDRIGDA
jgi:enoyl-CoA hydratase/carnithine racemase